MKKSLLSIGLMLSVIIAQATVLVYEGFNPADYKNVEAGGNVGAHEGKTTGEYTIGLTQSSWNRMNGTQIRVFGENRGLTLSEYMISKGFAHQGGSIALNPFSNSSDLRSMYHTLETDVLKVADGKLYVRMLLNIDEKAAGKLKQQSGVNQVSGGYFGCGFTQATSDDYYMLTSKASAIAFVVWKNTNDEYVLSISVNDGAKNRTTAPIITGIELGTTYVCFAEIEVNAGTDSKEIVNAGAFAASSNQEILNYQVSGIESQFISSTYAPSVLAVAGPYGTNNGFFRVDEIIVGTEQKDVFPVGGVFGVNIMGELELGLTNYSTLYRIVADEGVKADVYAVYSTDESFENATTNSVLTGIAAGEYSVDISNLEMNTTYYLKLVADNGSKISESEPISFTTRGVPIIGNALGTVNSTSFNLSVELLEAAVENSVATTITLFLKNKLEDEWIEFEVGTSMNPTTFDYTVENLSFGVDYEWYVEAKGVHESGAEFSAVTTTKAFMTMWNKDMYVNAESTNAIAPYSTPETAAKTIGDTLKYATSGAKIYVQPGVYPISTPLNVTNAISIIGMTGNPSDVVVSNTIETGYYKQNQRVVRLAHPEAFVANLTMIKGEGYSGNQGGNFYISVNGGTISNCVSEAGYTRDNAEGSGGYLDGGLVTHTIFRKNRTNSGSADWSPNRSGVLRMNNSAKVENCLFEENHQYVSVVLIRVEGKSVFRNNTIVNNSLSLTNENCTIWSSLLIGSGATVENNIIAATTNKVDGASAIVTGSRALFKNGALDYKLEEDTLPADTIVGTPEEFFTDYAAGNYRPKTGGVLINKGVNYEGMPLYDLSGTKLRLIGSRVDIGCYEGFGAGTLLMIK